MKQYNIFFYRSKKDFSFSAMESKEFKTLDDLINWSNEVKEKQGYYTYLYFTV